MSTYPRVSVVIPAYNVRSYLEDALISLEHQSFQAFEAIVVDDGSTDGTADLVEQFCQRDPRFRLLIKPNGGLSSARNYGIRQAQAQYIAMLDGDDRYEPDKLANHVARLDRDPQIGVVYSASKIIRDDGQQSWMSLSGKPIFSDALVSLLCKNFIGNGSNAMFRRALVDEVGEFDETLRSSEDLDFWLRVAATRRWRFYRESQALCCYRVRSSGLSFNVAQMQRSHEQVLQAAYLRSPEQIEPWLPTAYAYMYRLLARLALTGGDTKQAQQLMQQAWDCDRSIFYRDPRSLLTLLAVKFAPIAKQLIERSLGKSQRLDIAKSIQSREL
ncbi:MULTISPECIES: glycosyltransferase family 2 protein [Leptolyngbya]|uniref:glycosyltransferase family 2 protein n=1 Tax=Leptolyngbya TaxID=47251 RepID=UPI001688759C|nr:glycosyltransferase family A protein [Leptolyngbya sp. FACHB-1624]MBD1859874.1 glycosyltransferase family 2 protein [Leptolyngbya sp. FACHB-1624]